MMATMILIMLMILTMIMIKVKFEVDVNGMLHVSAIDFTSGKHERITISQDSRRLNTEVQMLFWSSSKKSSCF